jgi:hypothetical protein
MLILAVVAVALAGLGLAAYFVRAGAGGHSPEVCHAHCPRCDQRVRYGTARAGSQIMCPRCRRRWTLPTTASLPAPAAAWRGRELAGRRPA